MITKGSDDGVYRYKLSIELRLSLIPLTMFANSQVLPTLDIVSGKWDLQTVRSWLGPDNKSIFKIDEPEKECFLFYANSKESEVDAVVRLAGQTKNVLAIVLLREPTPGISTVPVFVVKCQEVDAYMRHPSGTRISIRPVSSAAMMAMKNRKERREAEAPLLPSPLPPRETADDLNRRSIDGSQSAAHVSPRNIAADNGVSIFDDPCNDQGSSGVEVPLGTHPLELGESSAEAMASTTSSSAYSTGVVPGGDVVWDRSDNVERLFGQETDRQLGSNMAAGSSCIVVVDNAAATGRKGYTQGNDYRKIIDDEDYTTQRSEKNILVRGFDALTGPFRCPDGWDVVLGDLNGWKRRGNSNRYIEAMDRFEKALSGEDREKVLEIAGNVHQYLQKNESTILQLAFAAKVFYKSGVPELAIMILVHFNVKFESVTSMTFDDVIRRTSIDFDQADRKPYNIFHAFFMRVFNSWNFLGPLPVGSDAILACVFNFWVKCGMLQRKNIDWHGLRLVVSSLGSFSPCEHETLKKSIGVDRATTLGLLLCENVEQAVHILTVTRKATHVRYVAVEPIFSAWLINRISDDVSNLAGDLAAIGRVWKDVLVALDFTSFRQSSHENFRRDVLSSLVGCCSFRTRKSFQYYLLVLEAVRSSYTFYDSLLDLVRESIMSDLRSKEQPPQMHDFLSMLESTAGEVLSSACKGENSILEFVKSTISNQSFEEQAVFIGRFFEILFDVGRPGTSILKRPGRLVPTIMTFAIERHPSKPELWIAAFRAAKRMPLLFERCGDEQVRTIVELILPTDKGAELLEQPRLVVDLLRLEDDHDPGPFYVSLQARVEVILRNAASSINNACSFYLGSHNEASTPVSMAVAERIFLAAFSAWNPGSIATIMEKDENALSSLFRCFDGCPPPSVADCAAKVTCVVAEWHRAFQDDDVTRTMLGDSLRACQKAGWQPLREWTGIQLPDESQVAGKLDELESVAAEVFELLKVRGAESTSMSVSSILKGYNCHPTPNSELDRLLSLYEPFLVAQCPTDVAVFLDKNKLELRQIRAARDAAAKFIREHGDDIHVCDYFLQSPSALFRKGISAFTKNKLEVNELHTALQHTLENIASLFSPKTTFKDVDAAVKLVSTVGGEIGQELDSLAGCKVLQLTAEQQERFKAVALMSRFSRPLDRFVKFCRQFKFSVVHSDPNFKQLEAVALSLVSEEVVGLDAAECMEFSARLARLLCPQHAGQSSIVELRSQVENTLPYINTLGVLSTHSEIWTFARDMKWFGKEGLKKFYAEYNNCTNVLLGNTASYEMSVLYALQPSIRAVSLIGSLQGVTSLGVFLDALHASSDVGKCSHGGTASDLNQVHNNLSQIREWFTNGVDDIAAVYGLFEAVKRTGEYSIHIKHAEQPILTLAYQDRDGRKLLQGKDLVGFVQHVGLIQHEDERIANEVICFVELHRMLSKAASNVIEMWNLGFDADIASFSCCTGSGQLGQARELLRLSDVASRAHEGQLQALRENYRVSTLFFTEEVKEMYDIFTSGGPGSDQWPELVRKISRLLCPSMPRLSWEERCQVCDDVALAMKHTRNQDDVGWLRIGSKLIENLHGAFGDLSIPCDAWNGRTGRIVLHTLAVEDDLMNWAVFCLIRSIYKDRLPESFEVLDAREGCTSDHLDLFLRRAQMFTPYAFVLLNVDRLIGNMPEKLVSFLSRRDVASCGIHLHCIQSKPSFLHTGPWVDGATWDRESLTLELDKSGVRDETWKRLILDPLFVDSVRIVWTPSSGTGKSCYIRNMLNELQNGGSEVATITIHEYSSISSLVGDLLKKFSSTEVERAVHFNFCCLPDRNNTTCSWLESVNHFFFSLLILRSVYDPSSGRSFHLGERSWKIYLELPAETTGAVGWLRVNIPTLSFCGNMLAPPNEVVIDKETRRVCTYLRALRDGTINRKFIASRGRQIIFVLDRSRSMGAIIGGSTALGVATDNALRLFDSHVNIGDIFGLTMFNSFTTVVIPLQQVADDRNKAHLRNLLNGVRYTKADGTQMYNALLETVIAAEQRGRDVDTWIVCLTDGCSSTLSYVQLQQRLQQSSDKLRILLIGINLRASYENEMRNLCNKYRGCSTGGFVPSSGTLSALNAAFAAVASRIPVSQTFELFDGVLSDDECRNFLRDYTRPFLAADDMLMQTFFVRFLYRRVKVFDMNTDFNENVHYDDLGRTLMETMLEEVKRLLAENQRRDWIGENHAQLVYDFSDTNDPKFRLVCTSPDELSGDLRKRYEALDLPGFSIPTKDELSKRATLDRFLSQALGVPLHDNEDGEPRLKCIDEHGFILTLDFTMKLLNMHERVACRVPCLIEGETGVSKTALTKMYSILRNSALQYEGKDSTELDISSIERELDKKGFSLSSGHTPLLRLHETLASAAQKSIGDETEVAGALHELLMAKQGSRPALFRAIPDEFNLNSDSRTNTVRDFLDWFATALLEPTFFEVNVDASLTQEDVVLKFLEIRTVARKLLSTDALVVVFLDEINTTSIMGVFKEVVVDRTLMGEALEENIVVVAACNPFRTQATTKGECLRENDLGREWASGHYQVVELPTSLKSVRWNFGSLSHACEKDFIFRRMERICGKTMPLSVKAAMTEVVAASHEAMRSFALKNIRAGLVRVRGDREGLSNTMETSLMEEAAARASSVVSLRDIQRVFALYMFFSTDFSLENRTPRDAMMLAVAIVYYLRLDDESRDEFKHMIQSLPTERGAKRLQTVLDEAMDAVIAKTEVPQGIALTRGLKENVFMTLACLLSRTPLLIVGPPGTSKTLAVNITSDNSNGEDSPSEFYRNHARLSVYHYQCSKQSTSKEIAAVFEKATQQQEKLDPKKHLCFVFMDEAGLPEEEKESLKVLHYLLEGHMSSTSEVGFVGISNHVLDAAKSNRCVMLLRQEPDTDEMLSITKGVLFDSREAATCVVEHVDLDGEHHDGIDFASSLCQSYGTLVQQHSWFETFFGLRDFIYFLKALRLLASFQLPKMTISIMSMVSAIERNFNGVAASRLRQIALSFLEPVAQRPRQFLIKHLLQSLNDPLEVIRQSLCSLNSNEDISTRPRYKLIIDETDDDSIIRLLKSVRIVDLTKKSLFKLSQLPDDVHVERMRLVAGVKYAALQGKLAVLSQTEPVNEAMYDLFNQRFHVVGDRLFANIAIGGISRRSLVRTSFECVVHVRESQLHLMPAPFLNRFEKYTLGTDDVLKAGWSRLGKLATVFGRARDRVSHLLALFPDSGKGMFGWVDGQTLDSLFIDLLPEDALMSAESASPFPVNTAAPKGFADCLAEFLSVVTSLRVSASDVELDVDLAKSCLCPELRDILWKISSVQQIDANLVRETLHSLVHVNVERGTIAELFSVLIQMVVTRVVATTVIQIASPEAVYLGSAVLPSELVSAYFSKEHFSLRRVIEQSTRTSTSNKVILYARSDASIRSIPSLSMSHRGAPLDTEGLDKIKELVYGNVEELVIEHLNALRSETVLRTSVEAWIKGDERKIFLLIVDMGTVDSVDHVNFARTFVEQRLPEDKVKVFVMLLHHPPSVANRVSCYPALFLQGWSHVFLDGIGNSGPSFGVETCIELACKADHNEITHPGRNAPVKDLSSSLQLMLPRVVGHVASHMIFSAEQIGSVPAGARDQGWYRERYRFLMMHMSKSVDGETVGAILCSKFAALWLDTSLLKTMRRASEGLLRGRTQLSLSMSVRSNLLDTFDAYLLAMVKEMNQGQSLDILYGDTRQDVERLFVRITRDLPVAPFEELMLLRNTAINKGGTHACCRFPFFPFISQCLDDLLELASQEMASSVDAFTVTNAKKSDVCIKLHKCVMELLCEVAKDTTESTSIADIQQRRAVVRDVVRFVQQQEPSDDSLFEHYLHDFISCKTNCSSNGIALKWLRNKLNSLGFELDIVAVHVVIKNRDKEFMRVVSWSTSAAAQALEGVAGFSSGSNDVITKFMVYFERSLGYSETNRGEWSRSFARFLRQMTVLASNETVKKEQASRLRVLSFFHILLCCDAPASVQSEALQLWYDRDQYKLRDDINDNDVALSTFVGLLGVRDNAVEMTFRHFFSPRWVNITTFFRDPDFLFLLDYIAKAQKLDSQLTPMLRAACLSYDPSTCEVSTILGLPAIALHVINFQLRSSHSAKFSSNETRVSLPHFIPKWLLASQPRGDGDSEVAADDPEHGVYFKEYRHCFDGQLPETAFNMILQAVIREAETLSSEALLLSLLQDIEAESCLRRDEYTRLTRIRSRPLDVSLPLPPYEGSLVASMILDARLICFLAKTAFELATQQNASALSGTYGSLCRRILELCISMDGCRWGDFFFHTILQVRGEGTLALLLANGGALHTLRCCKAWTEGAPAMKAESQQELARAESELTDAIQEEHMKALELRLCPHCGTTFIVDARECGTFKCGRDAHGGIGGVQVRAIYGCGQQFNINDAPHYAIDASILNPLRARMEELRNCMQRCQVGASLWERARTMVVPIMNVCLEEKSNEEMFVPTASMAAQMNDESDAQTLLLLQRLGASSDLVLRQSVLPDLIELYVWLHGTFRYLITKADAMDIRMKDIMDPEKLCSRFDFDQAHHILAMWNRVSKGLSDILRQPDCKIFWQCEEIEFPFKDVGEAPLLALLSEGDHPTDGNDFLFLIINTIIERYNSFLRWMGEYDVESRDADCAYSLHPKFVMRGSYGAVVMSESAGLSETELDLLIESTWDSESQKFDTIRLNVSLKHELLLHVRRPVLLNPMDYLRERFCFRNESHANNASQERYDGITVCRDGNYFANVQDGQLYNDVCGLLDSFLSKGCTDIRRTLEDTFHTLDYNEFRSVLEGTRSVLHLLDAEGMQQMDDLGETLCTAYNVSRDQLASERSFVCDELGFPNFSNAQFELFVSLKPGEVVELVRFVGFQLASEAYQFSGLPLCLKEPLGEATLRQLNFSLEEIKSMEGLETTLAILDEFVRDVLSFYEAQICGEASSRSDSLRSFLLKNNYCDGTDRFFAVLPMDVSLRNYASLRCHLHQLKLSWLVQCRDGSGSCDMDVDIAVTSKPPPGQCWLWDEREASDTIDVKERAMWPDKPTTSLWFSIDSRNVTNAQDVPVVAAVAEPKIDCMSADWDSTTAVMLNDDLAARKIQRRWRRRIVTQQDRSVDMEEDFMMDDAADFEDGWDFPAEHFVEQQEDDVMAVRFGAIDNFIPIVTPPMSSHYEEEMMHHDTSRESRSRSSESGHVAVIDTEGAENKLPLTELDVTVPTKISKPSSPSITYESLYEEPDEKSTKATRQHHLYGAQEDEIQLRRWLNEHKLPQSVGDELIRIGARDVDDIIMIFEECEDELKHLKRLDQIKLKKAIQSLMTGEK